MFPGVNTKDPAAVEAEVQASYQAMFRDADAAFVPRAFAWVKDCFTGSYRDFQTIDALYHDLEHTMQGTLCMARLLRRRTETDAKPVLTRRMFELGVLAMLLHDTGYLKKKDDTAGTGAKYTLTHVARSVHFAEELLSEKGLPVDEILSVQHMIRCTGVHVDLNRIPFQSEIERIVGFALGTADLLGQMSAPDYVDKLGVLYAEFEESARFYEGKMVGVLDFASSADLIRRTPAFWEKHVRQKLDEEFWGLYRFLNHPYPDGPNEYIEQVEANIERLRKEAASIESKETDS